MKFSIKNLFSRCKQICSNLRICSHLLNRGSRSQMVFKIGVLKNLQYLQEKPVLESRLKKRLKKNFLFCEVDECTIISGVEISEEEISYFHVMDHKFGKKIFTNARQKSLIPVSTSRLRKLNIYFLFFNLICT